MKNTRLITKTSLTVAAIATVFSMTSCALQNDEDLIGGVSQNQDGGMVVKPPNMSAGTVSIVSFDNVLGNMTSVTGTTPSVANPNNDVSTINIYNQNKTSYALTGNSSEINAGMWMSISVLAGGVCRDLYNKEMALPANDRTYYREIAAGNVNNNFAAVEDVLIRRLALGFWGRPATNAEIGFFKTALDSVATTRTALNQANTRDALLITCTGALASLSAIEI